MGSDCMEIVSRTFCHLTILAGFSIFHFPVFNSFGRQSIDCPSPPPCCWQRLNFAFNCFIIHKVPPFWHCRWPRWPPRLLRFLPTHTHIHRHTQTHLSKSAQSLPPAVWYMSVWQVSGCCTNYAKCILEAWPDSASSGSSRNAMHPPELRQPQQSQSQTLPGLCLCVRAAEMLINFIKIALLIWFAMQRRRGPNRLASSIFSFSFPGLTSQLAASLVNGECSTMDLHVARGTRHTAYGK